MDTWYVNDRPFQPERLLGKGKGGYSYLVSDGGTQYVLKQIHHEPCDYYTFGDKLQSELRDYAKLKNAEKELTRQIELGENELHYLKSVLEELNRAQTDGELEEIRQELHAGGYVRMDGAKKRMKQSKLQPMRFESTDGYPIYVGRNNRQNDELTFKLARKDDLWLHASKVHGSHVIVSCGGTTPPDDTITQAAQLAAYYAESSCCRNIPVDVTPVKQVKKPAGGKPGMVIYHTYRTVIANPYADIVVDALNAEKKETE